MTLVEREQSELLLAFFVELTKLISLGVTVIALVRSIATFFVVTRPPLSMNFFSGTSMSMTVMCFGDSDTVIFLLPAEVKMSISTSLSSSTPLLLVVGDVAVDGDDGEDADDGDDGDGGDDVVVVVVVLCDDGDDGDDGDDNST